MPGITHWQHSQFHAYFPEENSFPSILGEILSTGLGINGFSWQTSPACTELETIVLHWIGLMLDLPEQFLPFDVILKEDDLAKKDKTTEKMPCNKTNFGGAVLLVFISTFSHNFYFINTPIVTFNKRDRQVNAF